MFPDHRYSRGLVTRLAITLTVLFPLPGACAQRQCFVEDTWATMTFNTKY